MKKTILYNHNAVLLLFLLILGTMLQATARTRYIRHFEYVKPMSDGYSDKSIPKKIGSFLL